MDRAAISKLQNEYNELAEKEHRTGEEVRRMEEIAYKIDILCNQSDRMLKKAITLVDRKFLETTEKDKIQIKMDTGEPYVILRSKLGYHLIGGDFAHKMFFSNIVALCEYLIK